MCNGASVFVPGAESHHCMAFRTNCSNVRPTHVNLSLVDLLGLERDQETDLHRRRRHQHIKLASRDFVDVDCVQSLLQRVGLHAADEELVHVKVEGTLRLAVANVCTLRPAEVRRAVRVDLDT